MALTRSPIVTGYARMWPREILDVKQKKERLKPLLDDPVFTFSTETTFRTMLAEQPSWPPGSMTMRANPRTGTSISGTSFQFSSCPTEGILQRLGAFS